MADNEAVFSINLGGDAPKVSKETAAALTDLSQRAALAEEAIKRDAAALRLLRGSSEEVKSAKEKLKAQIDANRTSMSAAQIQAIKYGTTLGDLKKASKDTEGAQKSVGDVLKATGGPMEDLRSKALSLSEAFAGADAGTLLLGGGLALLGAAFVATSAAIVAGTFALSRFILAANDSNRTLQLSRQWIAGSAEDSARMGAQIDLLRQKVPMTTEELSKLYATTRAGFDGARISGQGILNVVNAVAEASGAGADKAASKIEEILKRGSQFGRVGIQSGWDPFSGGPGGKGELAGTGLEFSNIAKNLATNLHVSIGQAETELRRGRVPIEAAALALRQSAEQAFGGINAAKLTTADEITKKFRDDLRSLTSGLHLDDLWKGIARIENVFSTSTTSGYALQKLIESVGKALGFAGTQGAPLLETGLRLAILEAVKLENVLLRAGIWVLKTFDPKTVNRFESAVSSALVPIRGLAVAFETAYGVASKLYGLIRGPQGEATSGANLVGGGAKSLGGPPEARAALGTGSGPSIVVAPAHAAGGVVAAPAPGEAFASVGPGETIVPRGGGSRGGITVQVSPGAIVLQIQAGGGPKAGSDIAAAIKGSSFLSDLTQAIEEVCVSAGLPVQGVP